MRLIKADKKVTIPSFNVKDGITEQTMTVIDFLLRYTKEGVIESDMVRLPDIINNVNLEAYTAGWIDGRQDLLKSTTAQAEIDKKKLLEVVEEINSICEDILEEV